MELTLALAARARAGIRAIPGVELLDAISLDLRDDEFDSTRLVIDTTQTGLSGMRVERLLRDREGIAPEMSDLSGIVCLVTIGDTRESIDALVRALRAIVLSNCDEAHCPPDRTRRSVGKAIAAGLMTLTPREAYFAPSEPVPLPLAVGRTCAEMVVPYPPGIPVLVPGEQIRLEKLIYLAEAARSGIHITGAADASMLTLRVVQDATT
jgi:lysine decarboxylase